MEAAVIECPEIPIALHLDHGPDFETCKSCIDGGFTSVMIDASSKPFAENIEITRKVVEYAHDHGVVVEAELGALAGIEDDVQVSAEESHYTHPEEVQEFVEKTGCDSLAIAIGTSHGAYKFKGEAKLDFERLEKIGSLIARLPARPARRFQRSDRNLWKCAIPTGGKVAGAAGVPEELLRKAAGMAICKINIDTDIRLAMTASIRKQLVEHPEEFDPRGYLKPARQAVKDMVQHKIKHVLGCSGKA